MAIKAIIFDLDGTITRPFFNFDAIRQEIGLTADAGPIWEAMCKMAPQQRQRAEDILFEYEQKAVEASELNEGALDTLQVLRQQGVKLAILTRNRRENAIAVAAMHGLEFDLIVGREQGPVKPDAFGVMHICENFGLEPTETMVVGDYLFDLQCARAAGATPVLFASHERADEFAPHADFVIEKMPEILQII